MLITEPQLRKKLQVSRQTLFRWRTDPTRKFPKPVEAYRRSLRWVEAEIDEFIASLPRRAY
ncbi:AlpA family phage regulatory protein [Altererythrobacter soli]|uniref:AlpA family phage regulatory protein n=1 Tax=Croceibacterium soli TaxID=1739690 RepID=A0A6I4UV85_9SPHN|nr:AlpA family phage regulatory protein [Croceibacterium soli]